MMNNIEFVKSLYDAFKRGELDTIYAAANPNIDWISNADPALIPWGGERKGVAAAKEFFKELSAHVKFDSFMPREFIDGQNFVTVLGHSTGSLLPSGSRFDSEWAHMFRISDGKVTEFREYVDTHALVQAYFGGDIHSVTIAPSDQTAQLHH
jgi:ketosteroid isomerase-like protein